MCGPWKKHNNAKLCGFYYLATLWTTSTLPSTISAVEDLHIIKQRLCLLSFFTLHICPCSLTFTVFMKLCMYASVFLPRFVIVQLLVVHWTMFRRVSQFIFFTVWNLDLHKILLPFILDLIKISHNILLLLTMIPQI